MKKIINVVITVTVTVASVYLACTVFQNSYLRLKETLIDLYGSFLYYLNRVLYHKAMPDPPVTYYSEVIKRETFLPGELNWFKKKSIEFFNLLFSGKNFNSWLTGLKRAGITAVKYGSMLVPCIVVVTVVLKIIYGKVNNRYG